MKTNLHLYSFDLSVTKQADAYAALCAKLKAAGLRMFESWGNGPGHYSTGQKIGESVTLETDHLFDNQWNTAPIEGVSETGFRVFDWAQDYLENRKIKRGYWLEQTAEMKEIRRNTCGCGYCGKQEPAAKGYIFCPHCLDSQYLKESELQLTRMQPIDAGHDRAPLTDAERAHLVPLYREAQLHGTTERGKARIIKARADVLARAEREIRNATIERDGFLWLMDHGINTDNIIYYDHAGRFCFGWRQPMEPGIKSAILDLISEFPFEYEIK